MKFVPRRIEWSVIEWFAVLVSFLLAAGNATAGAFMLPEGQGQFIAGIGYTEGSRRFDQTGTLQPTTTFRKADASGFLEYGLRSWLSLIAAPTLSHATGATPTNSVTGSDSSAVGLRMRLFGTSNSVLALQVLVQPPLGHESLEDALADGGARRFAADLRVPVATSFRLLGWPAFFDVQPGARLRATPFPTEARLDLTIGVRPIPKVMLLVQDFSAFAHSDGLTIGRTAYSKAQISLVYDFSPRWSAQAGGFRTIAGANAIRETGPFAALWYRF